ncbi:HAMP domain-containing sensor histidine kinase [Magnetospirillum sp. UT-4]|uniref:sensor histidine kinase n=1 Tax=Magnetospirillum sp. UT-4 TaxID=2681467 RepID=UPI0013847AE0|nr:HAMP domain-containing sensor histidine kinase [Magnetospirillum sp. UT-4]CAA7616769.1 conserved membrane hypothetical protein [Magnetospirillum sp. UT-4]
MPETGGRAAHSLATRLGLVACAFAAVPAFLYGEFSAAERANREVLLSRLQVEGQLIARGLAIGLGGLAAPSVVDTRRVLDALDPKGVNVRLLFRPAAAEGRRGPLYLIGAVPPLPAGSAAAERERLAAAGVLPAVTDSCQGSRALDLRYQGAGGTAEVLTSVVPFATAAGCWAVVTAQSADQAAGTLLERPYWKSPEVGMAAAVYALLAVLVFTVFGGLWLNLRRFGREARAIAEGFAAPALPFVKANRIPELDGVAGELDRMVGNLRATAEAFRFAAEENAHAFKTPIATIAQAVEPLRRASGSAASAGRSLQVIEASLERLDALVAASRRLDQVNADLVSPPRQAVDLSRLVAALLDSYDEVLAGGPLAIARRITPGCVVRAGTEMMETVVENILDNALSFSPATGTVTVTVARGDGRVVLAIDDQGPGAAPEVLERMFDRYVSHRPDADPSGAPHFGIGLWIVRRNLASVGGSVEARNRASGGLRVTVTLPAT